MRIQLLLDPKMYGDWVKYAADNKIFHNNDSDLIRKLIGRIAFTEKLDLDVYILRDKVTQLKGQILKRDDVISRLQTTRIKLQEDNDRLKANIKRGKKK